MPRPNLPFNGRHPRDPWKYMDHDGDSAAGTYSKEGASGRGPSGTMLASWAEFT